MKPALVTAAIAGALAWCVATPAPLAAQQGANAENASSVPRMPDGHPDLSGVWWGGADVGGRPAGGGRGPGGPPGRGRSGPPPVTFASLYNAEAKEHAKTLSDKDDPTLTCTPTAFGTLNVSMWDVGAVGQIVQTPKFVIMLTETYHGWQIIPFDGRGHRDTVPPSNRGDAIGHWDGDTFVVDKTNFNDQTWISAEGRVSFHSDQLHVTEHYRMLDKDTLQIEATVEDPKVLTKPWVVPTQTLKRAPFDQIMPLDCNSSDVKELIDAADAQKKK